jgi:hypothetical protein
MAARKAGSSPPIARSRRRASRDRVSAALDRAYRLRGSRAVRPRRNAPPARPAAVEARQADVDREAEQPRAERDSAGTLSSAESTRSHTTWLGLGVLPVAEHPKRQPVHTPAMLADQRLPRLEPILRSRPGA